MSSARFQLADLRQCLPVDTGCTHGPCPAERPEWSAVVGVSKLLICAECHKAYGWLAVVSEQEHIAYEVTSKGTVEVSSPYNEEFHGRFEESYRAMARNSVTGGRDQAEAAGDDPRWWIKDD